MKVDEASDEDGQAGGEVVLGSNRWGDLIFWEEILGVARAKRATAIVILTKDVKNDWRMGGSLPVPGGDGEKGESPAHPTLIFEAAQRAAVRELLLLDHRRLARLFDVTGIRNEAFAAACNAPPHTNPKTADELRAEAAERQLAARKLQRQADARNGGALFPDREGLSISDPKLRRAIVETEGDKRLLNPAVVRLANQIEQAAGNDPPISEVLTGAALEQFDHVGLVALARLIGLEAIERPLLETSLNDLAALIDRLPPMTATCFYLGLLAAAYLERDNNAFRSEPNAKIAAQVFPYQSRSFATLPNDLMKTKAARAARSPIYLPDANEPKFTVKMEVDTDAAEPAKLRAIWINDHQLLTPAQGDEQLQLLARFATAPATPERLLDHVAELYCLPRAQLFAETGVTTQFSLAEFLGFKDPQLIFALPAEETPA